MELKDYAIGALTLTVLAMLGFNIVGDENYICRDLSIAKYCDRLSGSEKTCYPTPATRVGSKLCSSGWEDIGKDLSIENTKEIVRIEANAGQYSCPTEDGFIDTYTLCEKSDGKFTYAGEII